MDRYGFERRWARRYRPDFHALSLRCLRFPKHMKKSGFTLLEVLIVVVVIGLLAGITFPRIGGIQNKFALRGAVNSFMSSHSLARAIAIRQGGVAELHIDPTNDRFWVEVDTSLAGSGVMDTIGLVVDLSESRVTLTSTQTLLCFDGRGLPSSAAGCATSGVVVAFNRENEGDTIRMTVLGKILR
ncbi:MAG: hypothetical protein BMS9Abin29_2647 [Gemmatimonadota bacterium]|nr:MAG: hypothetical protein BMS9Abin29_2647 [Gemmatimonadota bacterium]